MLTVTEQFLYFRYLVYVSSWPAGWSGSTLIFIAGELRQETALYKTQYKHKQIWWLHPRNSVVFNAKNGYTNLGDI